MRILTASQGILEDLLEAKEFKNGQVDAGVKSETTLVGAKSRVELDSVTAVDLKVALVIFPDDTELNNTLRNGSNSKGSAVLGVLVEERAVLEGRGELYQSKLEWELVDVVNGHCLPP